MPGLCVALCAVPAFSGPCPLVQRVKKNFRVLSDLHTHVLYWTVYTGAWHQEGVFTHSFKKYLLSIYYVLRTGI